MICACKRRQFRWMHRLHRALRAHWHEDRRLHCTMRRLPRLRQRGLDLAHVLAATSCKIRLSAAFSADDGGDGLDDLAGLHLGLVLFADVGHQRDVSTAGGSQDNHTAEHL
jgi:hypothetical protein